MSLSPYKEEKLRKNFYLSAELLERAEKVAREQDLHLSQIVGIALKDFVERLEREKLEAEMMEGCKAYYQEDTKIAAEWRIAETSV